MTSVQNHRVRLSGNKYAILFLLLFVVLMSSCFPKKRVVATPVNKEQVGVNTKPNEVEKNEDKYVENQEGVDTVVTQKDGLNGAQGTTDEEINKSISLMLPFFGERFNGQELPKNSEWSINFYSGIQLALYELEQKGTSITLNVFDTEGSPKLCQELVKDPTVKSSSLVLGPYLTKTSKAAILTSKFVGVPIVVPYSASSTLIDEYDSFFQVNPTLPNHLTAIADYLVEYIDAKNVVLVGLPNGEQDSEINYLLRQQRVLSPKDDPWRVWKLETDDVGLQDLNWKEQFGDDYSEETIFVFPIYKNPKIVLSFVSQLQIGRGKHKASVFGMPQWISLNQLDPTIMEDLGVKITASFFPDSDDANTLNFESAYISKFGISPKTEAYVGYDLISFLAPLVDEYGKKWVDHLPDSYDGICNDYIFQPILEKKALEKEEKVSRFENHSIQVLEYRNFAFRIVGH